jgi:hypothetical protein
MEINPTDDNKDETKDKKDDAKTTRKSPIVPPSRALGVSVEQQNEAGRNRSFFDAYVAGREAERLRNEQLEIKRADAESDEEDDDDEETEETTNEPAEDAPLEQAEAVEQPLIEPTLFSDETDSQPSTDTDEDSATAEAQHALIASMPANVAVPDSSKLEPLNALLQPSEGMTYEDVPYTVRAATPDYATARTTEQPISNLDQETQGVESTEPLDIWESAATKAPVQMPELVPTQPAEVSAVEQLPKTEQIHVPEVLQSNTVAPMHFERASYAPNIVPAAQVETADIRPNTGGALLVGGIAGWYLGRRNLRNELKSYRRQLQEQAQVVDQLEQNLAQQTVELANTAAPHVTPTEQMPAGTIVTPELYKTPEQPSAMSAATRNQAVEIAPSVAKPAASTTYQEALRAYYEQAQAAADTLIQPTPAVADFETPLVATSQEVTPRATTTYMPEQTVFQPTQIGTERFAAPTARPIETARPPLETLAAVLAEPEQPVASHRTESSSWHRIEIDQKTGKPVENPQLAYGQEFHNEQRSELLTPSAATANEPSTESSVEQGIPQVMTAQEQQSQVVGLPQQQAAGVLPNVSTPYTQPTTYPLSPSPIKEHESFSLDQIPQEIAHNLRSPAFWVMALAVVVGVLLFRF